MKGDQQGLRADTEAVLAGFHDPHTDASLGATAVATRVQVQDQGNSVLARAEITLGYPAAGVRELWQQELSEQIARLPGVDAAEVDIGWQIPTRLSPRGVPQLAEVRNLIVVGSGKGGVGKSTTAVNLALALSAEGAKVGLLDADIHGPSQGIMLGLDPGQAPAVIAQRLFAPMKAHGIQAMSMSCLTREDTPAVWRGPMVSGALQQIITQTAWQDLDYLVVDMPPGTGDVQLTLVQKVPVTGAVIVTTPQDIALIDAIKAIEMFRKVDVPVLGVVENMSVYQCSACGKVQHLFGEGGGAQIAERYDTALLGGLPLSMSIREQSDSGRPTVIADAESEEAGIYRAVARAAAARLLVCTGPAPPSIIIDD